jgi:NADH:ubiquinone oxidoreductase subunit 5 (subunit L)/multisubunit Na+/H+ antiporter MnhA subunit
MAGWPILSLTTFLPLVGAAFILLIRGEPDVVARNARNVALWTSLITFVLSLFIWLNFDNTTAAFQMVERADWIPAFKINYHMGVDGISVLFVQPARYLGYGLWKSGDGAIIDGVGPDGIAAATRDVAFRAARLQSGYVYHYAFVMVIGVVLLVGWFYFFG